MQKKYVFILILVALLAGTIVAVNPAFNNNNEELNSQVADNELVTEGDTTAEAFKWYQMKEALALQEKTGKKMFIDVYTTWCGPCKMLEANTFSNPVIQKLLSEYYIPTKFNAECGDTVVFKGQTFMNRNYTPTPRKSTHDFAVYIASTQQGLGYPTMVFLDSSLNMIQPISGYLVPSQLEPILSFFGTDAYKTTDWETYYKGFTSQISQ